jgi:SPP1 gp7 family putative phage head morphogenesis protein
MPLIFGRDGNRRNPLTAEEQALARVLYEAIRKSTNTIKVEELARIIQRLDPDSLNRLLNAITVSGNRKQIEDALMTSIEIGGKEAIQQIQSIAPKLALPAFLPKPVKITNKAPMANMDFTKIPAWASPTPPPVTFSMSFNKTNPNSLAFASKRAGQLIVSIDELTRIAIRKIIIDSFNEQIDYRATARRIKNIIGLHPKWAEAVTKFEKRELERLIKGGMKEAKAREASATSASKYADRLRSARATMIARTEIQIAQNEGRYEGWKQADEAGFIDPSSMKMWVTAQDERTCEICAPLDGELAPWNGVFSIGLEAPIVHPHCRCTMVIVPPDRGTQ